MTETTTPQIDVAALNALLQTVQQQAAPAQPTTSAWQQPQPTTSALNIQGVGVPVSVQTPEGKVRCTFFLGAEHAATPEALMSALETMANAGIPIDAWQDKKSGGSWGNSNNNGYKKRW